MGWLVHRLAEWHGMMTATTVLRLIGVVSLLALTSATRAQTATAVEYYYAAWDHYFVTSFPDEIAVLDGGAFGGVWKRTGETFNVWTQPVGNATETCRFFSTSFAPRSSHFYTPFASECTTLKTGSDWQYEGSAFFLQPPDASDTCAAGTTALYRLYNDGIGGAPNHRYTASRTTVDQMRARGWVSEGVGPDVIFACLPAQSGRADTAAGVWTGTTSANESVLAIILEDGTYYIRHSLPGRDADDGVFQGSASIAGGTFSTSNGLDFSFNGDPLSPVSLSGSYVPGVNLQLTLTNRRGTRTLSAAYVPGSGQSPSLAAAAGSYAGRTGHRNGAIPASLMLDANGNIQGINQLCQFSGTIAPRGSVNAFDLKIHATGGRECAFGGKALGVLYYDAARQEIRGFAPFDGRRDQYFLIGTKR